MPARPVRTAPDAVSSSWRNSENVSSDSATRQSASESPSMTSTPRSDACQTKAVPSSMRKPSGGTPRRSSATSAPLRSTSTGNSRRWNSTNEVTGKELAIASTHGSPVPSRSVPISARFGCRSRRRVCPRPTAAAKYPAPRSRPTAGSGAERDTAVDDEHLAGDPPPGRRHQEEQGPAQLVGVAGGAQGGPLLHQVAVRRALGREELPGLRLRETRRDAVHRDVRRAELSCQRGRQPDDRQLCDPVDRLGGERADRRLVHDRAATP